MRPPAPSPDFSAQQTTSHEPPSTPASVRATVDYDSDDDDDELVYATTKSVRGRGRDSISQLLPEDDLRELATPATSRSWRESYNNFMELNSGFLLIVLSQAAFAIVNCLVKLLEAGVPVPTWQIVWVRMTVTWIGAIGCTFRVAVARERLLTLEPSHVLPWDTPPASWTARRAHDPHRPRFDRVRSRLEV